MLVKKRRYLVFFCAFAWRGSGVETAWRRRGDGVKDGAEEKIYAIFATHGGCIFFGPKNTRCSAKID